MPPKVRAKSIAPTKKIERKANFDYALDLTVFQILVTSIFGIAIFIVQLNRLDNVMVLAIIIALSAVFIIYQRKFDQYKKKLKINDL